MYSVYVQVHVLRHCNLQNTQRPAIYELDLANTKLHAIYKQLYSQPQLHTHVHGGTMTYIWRLAGQNRSQSFLSAAPLSSAHGL